MSVFAPEPYALLPLTVFDKLFERTTFVTGWLLEGKIDADALASALDNVTRKWRMLAGRLHSVKEGNSDVKWYLKIPLGPLPADYPTYALTTSTSPVPITKHISIPIPSASASLAPDVFLHASTPRQYAAWEATNHPLTCWNVVYFPAEANNGVDYTCIGFARCHGVFDGGGAAQVMNALVAEMHGYEWASPASPPGGLNVNPIDDALARHAGALPGTRSSSINNYHEVAGYTQIGVAGLVKLVAWHIRERWWRGANRRIILLPKAVLDDLVGSVKANLHSEGRLVDHVTTGDILVAWIFKTAYSSESNSNMMVHCTNLASFRGLLTDTVDSVNTFPHNAFVPLPYPVISVSDVRSLSLASLTSLFSASRLSLSMDHVLAAYALLQKSCFPNPPNAQETLMISNVSASRILEADWSAVGAKRILCGYRYQATPTDVLFTNAVYIAGRLDNGTVVLDLTLSRERFDLLAGEIQRMNGRMGRNTNEL